ncbi:uncharacterized protein THITE_123781 [Thermothielavioides terrestris NRRL 8126]|uniref:GPI inositol-deacylase n=1 Tax=Thermothielavioides terrestris (strain ATCC 38088 / NRRL 8126) TaxID=578455 RepID=G2QT87_THETT|nr:uncharacterized protein THITE_123781 [Thermothielavioides terrestris NRRL 8126]AEO64413.1 hypothetical protein THITE_123781 [Thermothielavioides terrestris NRRL 8126]
MASHPTTIAPGDHKAYMRYAVEQARLSPPSPSKFCVGAVLVDADKNEILSTGYSEELPRDRPGDPGSTHAEHCCFIKIADRYGIHDFDIAKVLPQNTVLYTTMEPCNERLSGNRTCVERILGLGDAIKVVYVGIREPDTFIKRNEGIKRLEDAGIKVVVLDDDPDLRALILDDTAGGERLSRTSNVVDDGLADARGPLGLNLLHAPSEPLFDLVFVHGPGGGSRRTWSMTDSINHYWPREWLPKDPAFKNARIHSFGYASNWTKGNDSCLNIHQIGKSLLCELSTSLHFANSNTALILIGHSMGGLVIKKAYMLAHHENKALADRVRAMYFLGTPHRGSDETRLLKNILKVTSSAPAYVTSLIRGSAALQSINEEFRHYSAPLELWSFYETRKLRVRGLRTLIVDPEAATLGYREEKQMPMNADHRSICKFHNPFDQNYIIIRNSLVSTARVISQRDSIQRLASYLGVTGRPDEDLLAVQDVRAQGTCAWILKKRYYADWKAGRNDSPAVLWVDGKPGTGKSVLAGFVVDDVKQSGVSCSCYLFKHSDRSKSRLSACLRSLAFQMASVDPGIQDALCQLKDDRGLLDHDNERNLWRTLFSSNILKRATIPHCWVIDALDECTNFAPFLDSMLSEVGTSARLQIFITSRETPEICRLFASLGPFQHIQGHISAEDTLPDIERIVAERCQSFFNDSKESRGVLEKRIIEKSKGSFLWTVLVLDELSTAFSEEEIKRVINEVPRGMDHLYRRALDTMAAAARGKVLAKAILTWVTCVVRPLTVRGLECALEIDLKDKFPRLGEIIRTLCGQLVTIDSSDRVQMVHDTAREFLLNESLNSEFAIRSAEAHTRIARVCLEYLTGPELKPPRMEGRQLRHPPQPIQRNEFLTYSCETFSSHLVRADPTADHALALVDEFLKLNILTWIQIAAETRKLGLMIRTAEDLRTYASLCMVERSPLRPDNQAVRAWSVDLKRVAAKFADALVASPSSIYSRIPAFCPPDSAIHAIGGQGKRLSVTGLPAFSWDDRLSCLDFGARQTSALCYGEEFLAVGLRGGQVVLYHLLSCQEYRTLSHGEAVLHLQFREHSDMLASCGLRTLHVWNFRTGQQLHRLGSPQRCIGLVFYDNLLMAASNQNEFHCWDLDHEAAEQAKRPWRHGPDDGSPPPSIAPAALSIATSHRMMAVAYSGKPITIWDLEQNAYYGSCGKKLPSGSTSTHPIVALLFNPNPRIELLAASYLDGELVIIDPFADREIEKQRVSCHTLAASPDGRFLAGAGAKGIIQIFEFDTLRVLYKVRTSDLLVKKLAFSRDGVNLADLRGSQCNIWMPPVLLTGATLDDALSVDTSSTAGESTAPKRTTKITAMTLMPAKEGILCGKDDGSVSLYDTNSGDHIAQLYSHKTTVHTLQWLPGKHTVISTCLSNRVLVWSLEKVTRAEGKTWVASACILNVHVGSGSTIQNVLPETHGERLLISTQKSDHMWNLNGGEEEFSVTYNDYPTRRWLQHPRSEAHVVCFKEQTVHIHRWGHIAHVVGIFHRQGAARRSKLVFLDDRSWVCSIDLYGLETEEAAFTSYTRHFFVPYDWFAGTRSPIGAVTSYGDVVFAKNGDVAVVQGGLDYAD